MAENQNEAPAVNSDQQEPETRRFESVRFLFSRRGRPTLILVLVAIVGGLMAATWLFDVLSGPEQTRQQRATDQVARSGSTDVDPKTDDISGDLTSENLTDEAKDAARQYNAQANESGDIHPAPTFEDVKVVQVPGSGKQNGTSGESGLWASDQNGGDAGGQSGASGQNQRGSQANGRPSGLKAESGRVSGSGQQQKYSYTPPSSGNERRQRNEQQQRPNLRTGLTSKELEERRQARLEEVQKLRRLYQKPPEIASMDMTKDESGGEGNQASADGAQSGASRVSANARSARGGVGSDAGSSPSGDTNQQARTEEAEGSCEQPVAKAGEVVYANNDIALNTDHKGPVRMTFLQGELKGWQGMGQFQLNELGAKMNVTIDRLIAPNGQTFSANGYVLDPETTLWAMSSDVDRHLIYRYGGFGLATILGAFQDLAEAREKKSEISKLGESQTQYREPDGKQVTWQLLGNFGEAFQEVFADNIDRPITVTLDQNERAGVLFEDTVCGPKRSQSPMDEMRANGRSDPVMGG